MSIIAIPADLTTESEILGYVTQVYQEYFGNQTAGTLVVVEVGTNYITVNIKPPVNYTPVQVENPPLNTQSLPYESPAKFPAVNSVDAVTFQLFQSASFSWGSPILLTNGTLIIGGQISGTNVVASSSNGGGSWTIIGHPSIEIQGMATGPTGYPNRVVGRDSAEVNYVYSDDYGVTWTPFTPIQPWQGTGSTGFYN